MKTLLLSLLLAPLVQDQTAAPELRVSHVPEVGVIQTVSVGTPIHEYSRTLTYSAYIPDQRMRVAPLLIPITIEAGTQLFPVQTKTKLKACVPNDACALDDDGDGKFDRIAKDDFSAGLKLKVPVPYHSERITVDNPENIKRVLTYAGATSDTLRVSYREFSNNMARPAFSEDLIIPITQKFPQDIAVKEIRLRVHAISGLGMRYEILP